MNFKQATDRLFDRTDHADLAGALGVSIATVRQARLGDSAKAFRKPPTDWERAVAKLATKRMAELSQLLGTLGSDNESDNGSGMKQ